MIIEYDYLGLRKVISGGQTGADIAGLKTAKQFNVDTGGVAPAGWKTCTGPNPGLGTLYGLTESTSALYDIRTKQNIKNSDATLIVATKLHSPGTKLTRDLCNANKKPLFQVQLQPERLFYGLEMYDIHEFHYVFIDFLKVNNVSILNVAGNRDMSGTYHEDRTSMFLTLVFEALKLDNKLITKT